MTRIKPAAMAHKNILLMVADDLGKFLGCYGCNSIDTPNIDSLAAQGTKFDAAFASTASCSGSRSTIYTGLHTHQNGQYGLAGEKNHFMTFEHIETAPRIFNDFGYQTGIIGKIHVGPVSGYPWKVREESSSRNVAYQAERAGQFFRNAKSANEPFFLTVGFIDPHRDLTRDGFGNKDPTGGVDDGGYTPDDVEIPPYLSDLPEVRQELAQYYRSIHRLDRGVGMVMSELQRSGLLDDTLVIFVSDNGPPFINSKTTLYDAGIQLPLIIRQPGSPYGMVNPNMVSFLDLLPTMIDWAGHSERKENRLGRSLLPILNAITQQTAWDRVYGSHSFHEATNYWPTRYLRTRKYKYHRNIAHKLNFPFASDLYASLTFEGIRNSGRPVMVGRRPFKDYISRPPEELYDLAADPDEVQNLAESEDHASLLKEMRAAIESWQVKTKDPWLMRDGTSVNTLGPYFKQGLLVPDTFDMDPDDPSTRGKTLFRGPDSLHDARSPM